MAVKTMDWTEVQPAGDANKNWVGGGGRVSSDGQKMVCAISDGRMYKSSNGGVDWSETMPAGDANKNWGCIKMSNDGNCIFAAVYAGRCYYSSDFGDNWAEVQPNGNNNGNYRSIAMSADGTKLMVADEQAIRYSADSGSSWSTKKSGRFFLCNLSSDGSKMIAGIDVGALYYSSNTGSNWSSKGPSGNHYWTGSGMSDDGTKMIVSAETQGAYLSINSATSFNNVTIFNNKNNNYSSGMNSDGTKIAQAANAFRPYFTSDGGTTWEELRPGSDTNIPYPTLLSFNDDGTKFLLGVWGGRLYVGTVALPGSSKFFQLF